MKSVVIINHNPIAIEGIKAIIENDATLKVIGEGELLEETVQLVQNSSPDLLILEIIKDKRLLYKVISSVIELKKNTHILLAVDNPDISLLKWMLKIGVIGFIKSDSNTFHFNEAITMVSNGKPYISPNLYEKFIDEFNKFLHSFGSDSDSFIQLEVKIPFHLLTRKECDVLQLLAEGQSNREISESMNISEKTVKNHVSRILIKMQVKDRTNAVLLALKNGWVYLK
ncbi:response regulator transcription factor [Psychrobacillus sp. FSL K6-2684]|uniref:response regulator transcription factor n=1 Tax=unclassified Psychrobacillus TaxID=2636677 RepID=UPI0030F990F0